jgi:hypothetical protein
MRTVRGFAFASRLIVVEEPRECNFRTTVTGFIGFEIRR